MEAIQRVVLHRPLYLCLGLDPDPLPCFPFLQMCSAAASFPWYAGSFSLLYTQAIIPAIVLSTYF